MHPRYIPNIIGVDGLIVRDMEKIYRLRLKLVKHLISINRLVIKFKENLIVIKSTLIKSL